MLLLTSLQKEGFVHLLLLDRFFLTASVPYCQESLIGFLCLTCGSMLLLLQEVPEKTKESPGAPWQFVGLLSLFDPPRHDSAETIRRALNLGVNVKMITGN